MTLIGETGQLITARNGFQVLPHHAFDGHPELDVLLIPGGVHLPELSKRRVIDWIQQSAASVSWLTSVCTGAFLLAEAGLLTGRR